MMDVEFLQAPKPEKRLVYLYQSGVLRPAMARAIVMLAESAGAKAIQHPADQFADAVYGFFDGPHWADLGGAKLAIIEEAMVAMLAFSGVSAIFVRASSGALQSDAWMQLRGEALVISEATPRHETIDGIVAYALTTSDLSPPSGLAEDRMLQRHLIEHLDQYDDLGDVLGAIDDFILTGPESGPVVGGADDRSRTEAQLRRAIQAFIANPKASHERELVAQVLLRGDDSKLAIGSVTASTIGLLSRVQGGADELIPNSKLDALVLWSLCLLAAHHGLAVLGTGYAPSWRANPELRGFVIAQVCRDFRRCRGDEGFRLQVIAKAGDAFDLVRILGTGDEKAVYNLRLELFAVAKAMPRHSPVVSSVVGMLLDPKPDRRPLVLDFSGCFGQVEVQPVVIEQLRRRILANKHSGAVLMHWREASSRDLLASVWIKALLCDAPVNGNSCGACASCRALERGASPSVAVARLVLAGDTRTSNKAEDDQVEQVRRLIFRPGLFSGRRMIVLDGVDDVRKAAVDRLLKAIEEAPNSVSFLFLAERLDLVPSALRSRSQVVKAK